MLVDTPSSQFDTNQGMQELNRHVWSLMNGTDILPLRGNECKHDFTFGMFPVTARHTL